MRVLIATVTAGAGHLQAAAALEEAWRLERSQDVLEKVDVLDFVSRLQKKVYAQGWMKLVEHAPEVWGMAFNKTDNPPLLQKIARFRRSFARNTNPRFVQHLRAFAPEVVLCTHFLPLEILGALRAKAAGPPPFTVCVVTDFEAHAFWMEAGVDLYCVAAEQTKARLVAHGVPDEKVLASGIPVSLRFSRRLKPAAIRKGYGLRDDQPVLLVLSGGFGVGPVAEILAQIDKLERAVQVLVVTGRNVELRRDLAGHEHRHPTHVLGFVNNMEELMAVADLVLTKPGGLTTSEALALGKPIFVLNPIPGQEAANSDFLLQHGAAAKVNRIEDLPFRLEQLFAARKLPVMARAAKALGRPHAAATICHEVLQRVKIPRGDGVTQGP